MKIWTKKRKRNNLVPPLRMCKLIPAGEFNKSVFVWQVTVWEKLDDDGNVIESGKMLAVIDRDATGEKHKVPKTAKERLELLQCFQAVNKTIYYTEAIYPAPTLPEIITELEELEMWKSNIADEYTIDSEFLQYTDENPTTAALKVRLKLKGIEF